MMKKLILAFAAATMIGSVCAHDVSNNQGMRTKTYKEELALIDKYLELHGVESKEILDLVSKLIQKAQKGASAKEILAQAEQDAKVALAKKPSFFTQLFYSAYLITIYVVVCVISVIFGYSTTFNHGPIIGAIVAIIALCLIPLVSTTMDDLTKAYKANQGRASLKTIFLESFVAGLWGIIWGTPWGATMGVLPWFFRMIREAASAKNTQLHLNEEEEKNNIYNDYSNNVNQSQFQIPNTNDLQPVYYNNYNQPQSSPFNNNMYPPLENTNQEDDNERQDDPSNNNYNVENNNEKNVTPN